MASGTASLRPETAPAFMFVAIAFNPDIAAGPLVGKLTSVLSGRKINPVTGACSISAFDMSSGAPEGLGLQASPHNQLRMRGVGATTVGQITSLMAGEVMLLLVPMFS